jgi:hypothetical protein
MKIFFNTSPANRKKELDLKFGLMRNSDVFSHYAKHDRSINPTL